MKLGIVNRRALPAIVTLLAALCLGLAMIAAQAAVQPGSASAGQSAAAKKRAAKKRAAKRRAAARLRRRIAGLKFYNPPKRLPKGHGKLIWQRKAGGLVPLASASTTRLVLYTSTSVKGKPIAVSGSVSFPKGKAPAGGWPLITYGHGTTGIADRCAPSRNTAGGPAVDYISYIDPELNRWLDAGYAVARSDYEGLGVPKITHPFLVRDSEGRGVLDIVRAARQIGPKVSKNYLIAGHSQGGQAALGAAGLAASWIPDLKLKGTVAYAPASNFKTQAQALSTFHQPSAISALGSMLVKGMSVAYPSVKPAEVLSDPFVSLLPDIDSKCEPQLAEADSFGGLAPMDLLRSSDLGTPANANLLTLLDKQNPAAKSVAPILLLQGDADSTTPPMLTLTLKNQLAAWGNDLTYKTYPGADHGTVILDAQPDVMDFFQAKLPSGS